MSAPIPSQRTKFESITHNLSTAAAARPPAPQSQCNLIATTRNETFHLGSIVGRMCSAFLAVPYDGSSQDCMGDEIANLLAEVLIQLCRLANVCGLDLRECVLKKMELNGRKYPVELCKGKSGKYTKYSQQTGITKTEGQSTLNKDLNNISFESTISDSETQEADTETIEGVTLLLRQFALDRLWNRYHTPRNIALALMGEVGELAELFQWSGDVVDDESMNDKPSGLVGIGWSEEEVDKVGQEVADVTIYLIRLADVCGVSLGESAMKLVG